MSTQHQRPLTRRQRLFVDLPVQKRLQLLQYGLRTVRTYKRELIKHLHAIRYSKRVIQCIYNVEVQANRFLSCHVVELLMGSVENKVPRGNQWTWRELKDIILQSVCLITQIVCALSQEDGPYSPLELQFHSYCTLRRHFKVMRRLLCSIRIFLQK